ncbi:succinyldiaminopimelate transaminase [Propionibacteriaceae bacterium Y2011]|uniref:succinyldiaminopimelate transaminase n=1 Tax=Microlunatus sp. Y2014 TaxID=3418488 RepID=UPI003B4B03CF
MSDRPGVGASLPDFPWDSLAGAGAVARAHPDGIVNLSVGTPVDPTPELGQRALTEAADSPGYPTTIGTPELRAAMVGYLRDRWAATELTEAGVLPVIGTKELVAWLPILLGLRADDTVMYPSVAYPTYAVGAQLAGCRGVAADGGDAVREHRPALLWLNSPSNPTGQVLDADELADVVAAAREVGAVVASDECYGEFGWEAEPVSVLDARVNGGSYEGLLAIHSLSKRSNLAGYRAGLVGGDAALVGDLTQARKHLGMMVSAPVQAAMAALLADQSHVAEQRRRYAGRRQLLRPALERAGFRIDHAEAGLYLWATRQEDCRASVDWFAERGILVAPGDFYGTSAGQHVRIALTATDERIDAAASRL